MGGGGGGGSYRRARTEEGRKAEREEVKGVKGEARDTGCGRLALR